MNIGFAQDASRALLAVGFEDEPGYCLRWVRQVFQCRYGIAAWPIPLGLDARGAYEWLLMDGTIEPSDSRGSMGDILWYVGRGHGPHGHVAIRIAGNLVAENSLFHRPDGRGTRLLHDLGAPSAVWDVSGFPLFGIPRGGAL